MNWFADYSESLLPTVRVFSLPVWWYRLLMLAWALWFVYFLVRRLNQGFSTWIQNGWKGKAAKTDS